MNEWMNKENEKSVLGNVYFSNCKVYLQRRLLFKKIEIHLDFRISCFRNGNSINRCYRKKITKTSRLWTNTQTWNLLLRPALALSISDERKWMEYWNRFVGYRIIYRHKLYKPFLISWIIRVRLFHISEETLAKANYSLNELKIHAIK